MFNPTQLVIDEFVEHMKGAYHRTYGLLEPEYPNIVAFVGRIALENIANSDASYHDVFHTIMVTEVGLEILRGKHISQGGVSPKDWLHFAISLLCHDIGFVRGACLADDETSVVVDESGTRFRLPRGASDAILAPYHVTRGKIVVRERFANHRLLDSERLARAIELTRFPVPDDQDHKETDSEAGLVRAADLIGQLADPNYPSKLNALFQEFSENGIAETMGLATPADLVDCYPKFFLSAVEPFIGDGLRYLRMTVEGKRWVTSLYGNVFMAEHRRLAWGPQLGS